MRTQTRRKTCPFYPFYRSVYNYRNSFVFFWKGDASVSLEEHVGFFIFLLLVSLDSCLCPFNAISMTAL